MGAREPMIYRQPGELAKQLAAAFQAAFDHLEQQQRQQHAELLAAVSAATAPPEGLESVQKAAARVHVHPDTIRRWIRDTKLESVKVGGNSRRVRSSDLVGHQA